MEQAKFKMNIKAKVDCPPSPMRRQEETYHGKDVEIIDFVATSQGLVAVCLMDNGDGFRLLPLYMGELIIAKD